MPDPREVEVAAEHFAREHLRAKRTRRALRTKWNKVDFFGADVLALDPDHRVCYVQVTKRDHRAGTEKRQALENLAGPDHVPLHPDRERRIVLYWRSRRDPDDGRRTVHEFTVQELLPPDLANARPSVEFDGRSATDPSGNVWADWSDPVQIDKTTWYETR